MSVEVREDFQAVGSWRATLNNTPAVLDALTVKQGEKRVPRKLHWLLYDSTGALTYVGVLLTVTPGREGIEIGGQGVLWHLGSGDIGPKVDDREYVAGTDKLDNGSFALGGLYWRTPSQDSRWVLSAGTASNVGGMARDDVLEIDRKFPTRGGYNYRATALGVTGTGRLRLRIIFEGTFGSANRLVNWVTVDALTIGPIAKPQLISGWDFASGAGWTVGSTMSISGGKLIAAPNPQPQYIGDPGFENGTGWTAQTTPAPMSPDVTLVNNPAQARFGSWVMKVGPVTQHQVLTNAAFEDSGTTFPNWYESTNVADPDTVFYLDATGGLDGGRSVTTDNAATYAANNARTVKYLRADSNTGLAGPQAYDISPGEQYEVQAHIRAAPNTNGTAYISIHIPHPTVANRERWYVSQTLEGTKVGDDVFRRVAINLSVPANRFKLDALFEVHNATTGFWAVDDYTVTRTRGNHAQSNSNTSYGVTAGVRYTLGALVRSGGEMQVGSVRIGVILTGPGMPTQIVDVDRGSTDFEWTYVPVDFTPPTGYNLAKPFVAGQDIVGDPAWVDHITLSKVEGNTDVTTHSSVAVTADQRYLLSADVQVAGATRGTVTVGVTLSGQSVANQVVSVSMNTKEGTGVKTISTEVRPGPGYSLATLFVRSTDIEGGDFHIYQATLTKLDNNTATSTGTAIAVTPERTYRWSQSVRSGANLQRGTVKLSALCTRAGYPDLIFESSAMDATANVSKKLEFDVTPPSGYASLTPRVIGTDIEADNWYVGAGEIRDTDTTTIVSDVVSDNPVGAGPLVNSTAPLGAESVRIAVIAEQGSTNWSVDSVSLIRTGVTLATGNAIVADVLKDPKTGLGLSIAAGTLSAPAVIPHDWWVLKRTNRQILDHLCNVIYKPALEYHVAPGLPPTLSVGPRATVFADLTDYILLLSDRQVIDIPPAESNVELRPTEVELIGAERQTLSGRRQLVASTAAVAGPVEYDFNNRAIVRTETVTDTTVDHQEYADAFAADLAAKRAEPPLQVTIRLSGTALTPCKVGDTIYPYYPAAGLENLSNPRTVEGETVFPRGVRILSRLATKGPSHSCVMRNPDGTTFPIKPLWSKEDSTELTVGDRVEDWTADPQGNAASIAFLRDYRSRPR